MMSCRCGRVPVTLCTRAVDIGLMVAIAFLPTGPGPGRAVLLAVHLIRRGAANCTRPLMRSILMQHVPKRHRGKVNALDSVRTFSWSGSSALGGCAAVSLSSKSTLLVSSSSLVFSALLGIAIQCRCCVLEDITLSKERRGNWVCVVSETSTKVVVFSL
jgi:MFS family permease